MKKIILTLFVIALLIAVGCSKLDVSKTETFSKDSSSIEIGDYVTINCAHLNAGKDWPLINVEDMINDNLDDTEVRKQIFNSHIPCSTKKVQIFDIIEYQGKSEIFDGNTYYSVEFDNGVKMYIIDNFIKEVQDLRKIKEAEELGWLEVTEFKGQGTKTTSSFKIESESFHLTAFYSTSEDKADYSKISIFVYRKSDNTLVSSFDIDGASCTGDEYLGCINADGTSVYEGNNEYYLKVIATNLEEWSIKISEKYK